jgi:hypothetical protein
LEQVLVRTGDSFSFKQVSYRLVREGGKLSIVYVVHPVAIELNMLPISTEHKNQIYWEFYIYSIFIVLEKLGN